MYSAPLDLHKNEHNTEVFFILYLLVHRWNKIPLLCWLYILTALHFPWMYLNWAFPLAVDAHFLVINRLEYVSSFMTASRKWSIWSFCYGLDFILLLLLYTFLYMHEHKFFVVPHYLETALTTVDVYLLYAIDTIHSYGFYLYLLNIHAYQIWKSLYCSMYIHQIMALNNECVFFHILSFMLRIYSSHSWHWLQ